MTRHPIATTPRDARARLRDHLYANGPCSVSEAARACGLSLSEVADVMRRGGVQTTGRALGGGRRCVVCREPAADTDLCADCREGFRAAARARGAI